MGKERMISRGIGSTETYKTKTKKAGEVKVGDYIVVNDLDFVVYQIDTTKRGFCFVDKYACDYNVGKDDNIEILKEG